MKSMAASRVGARTIRPWSRSAASRMARRAAHRELAADRGLDRVGEGRVRGHEDGGGVGAMLGLGDQVGRDAGGVGGRGGQDHPLRGSGRQVDADLAADLDLGRGHPGVAGADDAVDGREARVREAIGEGADRLRAAGDDERIDLEEAGRAEQDRVACGRRDRPGRRRRSTSTPATRAGTTVITSEDG